MFTTLFRAVLVALVASLAYAFLPSHVNSAVFSPAVATLTHSSSVSLPRIVAAALVTSSRNNDCNCSKCKGTGALNCIPCKGTGIDKVNGNVFERWTCSKCKGFGFVKCQCNPTALTPEQRGER